MTNNEKKNTRGSGLLLIDLADENIDKKLIVCSRILESIEPEDDSDSITQIDELKNHLSLIKTQRGISIEC